MESMSENQSGYNDESQFQSLADTVDLPPAAVGEISKGYQTKLRRLAVTELTLGFLCFLLGAAIAGIVESGPFYARIPFLINKKTNLYSHYAYGLTLGAGFWCGIWVVAAGAFGIRATKLYASRLSIKTYMVSCIFGAVFSLVLLGTSVDETLQNTYSVMNTTGLVHLTVLDSILCLISLLSFILMVVSASLCGVALRCCGGQCICSGGDPEKDCCM